jgi:hypothetical protein
MEEVRAISPAICAVKTTEQDARTAWFQTVSQLCVAGQDRR